MMPDRQGAANRLRFAKDRRLSVGAFSLLRYALIRRGEKDVFPIETGEHGKPFFPDRPDICFNLSHSGDVALCALSDTDVGCDVEAVRRPPLSVAKRYFSSTEREYLASARTEEERADRFFRVWTLKESVMKRRDSASHLRRRHFPRWTPRESCLRPKCAARRFSYATRQFAPDIARRTVREARAAMRALKKSFSIKLIFNKLPDKYTQRRGIMKAEQKG